MEPDGLALFIAEPPQANITTIIIRLVCKDGYLFFSGTADLPSLPNRCIFLNNNASFKCFRI